MAIEKTNKKVPIKRTRKSSVDGKITVKRSRTSGGTHVVDLSSEPEQIVVPAIQVMASVPPRHSSASPLRLYKKIALTFIIFAVLTLAIISYFAMVKLEIDITPKVSPVAAAAEFSVYDRPDNFELPVGSIFGLVRSMDTEISSSHNASSSEVTGAEVSGSVTIYNKYTKDQPLVATTRLLTATNQLLRLKNTVLVPAGGSVVAEVYGETVDPSFALADARLTIPGLWAGLQDKIYAEAKANEVSYKEIKKYVIAQKDFDAAIAEGKKALLEKAEQDIAASYPAFDQRLLNLDNQSITFSFDAKAGDEVEKFNMSMSAKVVVVAFSKSAVGELDQTALASALKDKQSIIESTQDDSSFELISADEEDNIAEVKLKVAAEATTTVAGSIVDPNKLIGLNRAQISTYLDELGTIESYELTFTPSFFEIAPQLPERITVRIK